MRPGGARGRKFQPQIPRETLLTKTTEALRQSGVDHHSHARIAMKIAREALRSEDPLLATLHPAPKYREKEAWARAYNIAEKFLEQAGMAMTIKTMARELGGRRSEVLDFLGDTRSAKVIWGLIRFVVGVDADPIRDQAAAFCGDRILRKTNRQIQARRFFPDGAPKLVESREVRPRSARKVAAIPSEPKMPPPREAIVTPLEELQPPKKFAQFPPKSPASGRESQKKPEPAKKAESVAIEKTEPVKKPEPLFAPDGSHEAAAAPFKKPTIHDMASAPNPVTFGSSSFEPSSPSTSKAITAEETWVEDFNEGSAQEEMPSNSVARSMGSDDFEVTVQDQDSDRDADSAVDDVSRAVGSEVVIDSGQVNALPLSSIMVAKSSRKRGTGKSELEFEYVKSQDSGGDDFSSD
jgi:hypothetical protein